MRLLLNLLALLTGFATADRAMAVPVSSVLMVSLVLRAESANKAEASDSERRPTTTAPTRRTTSGGSGKPRKAAPPHLPGLLTGSDRALE